MTNYQVIKAFIERRPASVNNVKSTGDKLFSYDTCIAQRHNNIMLINNTKYSMTTSRHLSMFKFYYKQDTFSVNYVPKGSTDLLQYFK